MENRVTSRLRVPAAVLAAAGLALGAMAATAPPAAAADGSPGARPVTKSAARVAAASATSIAPFYTASGAVSLSTVGAGSNNGPVGRSVIKPVGATVRAAFLMAAGTGFSGYTPSDGDVSINGTPVDFDDSTAVVNSIGSGNVRADVTTVVKPALDAAAPGPVAIDLAEGESTVDIDGEILAVVFNDPNVGSQNSVSLLYGAQQTTGDTFNILLSKPVVLADPALRLTMGLGISYGFQPSGQFSQVDVNGQRLTTSAGGQDDGASADGALITVGGVGDDPGNPADPNANDFCAIAPRCDDELYTLKPFVHNGDTTVAVDTLNPSNDDNIFFSSLEFRGTSAVVGEGIVLSPPTATRVVGQIHTATATVQDAGGNAVANKPVTFRVTSGPNTGFVSTANTNPSGQATATYSSAVTGVDTLTASFVDSNGATQTSNVSTVSWSPPTTGATCNGLTATIVSGAKTVNGTAGNDVIVGGPAAQVINGLGGDDTICGGDGNDVLQGGAGNDWLDGEGGMDMVLGQAGNDIEHGGAMADKVGGPGNDPGNDQLFGDAGKDQCFGTTPPDTISTTCESTT